MFHPMVSRWFYIRIYCVCGCVFFHLCSWKLEELVTLFYWFYSLLLNKALYLSLKVKKERRSERYAHGIVQDRLTYIPPVRNYLFPFHSLCHASGYVLHRGLLCFSVPNSYHVSFNIWHRATVGSTVPPPLWLVQFC